MTNKPPEQPAGARRWLPTLAAISCTVWVISNIAAIKPLQIPGLRFITMDGGNLLFPISYILGDVLVEVYGYAQARRVIWLGVLLNLFAAGTFALVSALPPPTAGTCKTPSPLMRETCASPSAAHRLHLRPS